jgi:hypothetical protein
MSNDELDIAIKMIREFGHDVQCHSQAITARLVAMGCHGHAADMLNQTDKLLEVLTKASGHDFLQLQVKGTSQSEQ